MKKHLFYIFSLASLAGLVTFGGMTVPATASTEAARDDSAYIQNLIDSAVADSDGMKTVTVPAVNPNDPNGGSTYLLSNAIVLSSNTTVKLDNCTLRLNDGVLCNIFMSKGCYDKTMTAEQELKNIKIIGIGNAVLDGGKHNGVTEKTATSENGYSTVRHNHSIHFRNVDGFEISNLKIVEPRYWGLSFVCCENGVIKNIDFDCSNQAPNQDGIDLRIGCNNFLIEGITGVTGDDTVALTALSTPTSSDTYLSVEGKDKDIHDVTIKNLAATCNGGHGIIRLLAHHGNQIYNVKMENIVDTSTNIHVYGVLRIGDTNYAGSGTPMAYGDIHDIEIDGVVSNGHLAILAPNKKVTSKHVTYKNITTKYGQVTDLFVELEPVAMNPLQGEKIFSFAGGVTDGWNFNNNDIRSSNGILDGNASAYTMWPLGPGKISGNAPLQVSTAITNDTSVFDTVKAQLFVAIYKGNDPTMENLALYYSTDNGNNWSPVSVTLAYHGGLWKTSGGSTYDVYSLTSANLSTLTDKPITNLMIRPYGNNGSLTVGAFRLISLDVVGEMHSHSLEAVSATNATETSEGIKAHWKCTGCDKLFADSEGITEVTLEDLRISVIPTQPTEPSAPTEPTEPSTAPTEPTNPDTGSSQNTFKGSASPLPWILMGAFLVIAAVFAVLYFKKR